MANVCVLMRFDDPCLFTPDCLIHHRCCWVWEPLTIRLSAFTLSLHSAAWACSHCLYKQQNSQDGEAPACSVTQPPPHPSLTHTRMSFQEKVQWWTRGSQEPFFFRTFSVPCLIKVLRPLSSRHKQPVMWTNLFTSQPLASQGRRGCCYCPTAWENVWWRDYTQSGGGFYWRKTTSEQNLWLRVFFYVFRLKQPPVRPY